MNAYLDEIEQKASEASNDARRDMQQTGKKRRGFSEPGENRQLSILNGLKDILAYADKEDVVIIHDAARPDSVSQRLDRACNTGGNGCHYDRR